MQKKYAKGTKMQLQCVYELVNNAAFQCTRSHVLFMSHQISSQLQSSVINYYISDYYLIFLLLNANIFFLLLKECRLFVSFNKCELNRVTANSVAQQMHCFLFRLTNCVHWSLLVNIFETSGPLTFPFPLDHTPVHHSLPAPTLLHLSDAHSRSPMEVKEPVDVAPSQRLTPLPPVRPQARTHFPTSLCPAEGVSVTTQASSSSVQVSTLRRSFHAHFSAKKHTGKTRQYRQLGGNIHVMRFNIILSANWLCVTDHCNLALAYFFAGDWNPPLAFFCSCLATMRMTISNQQTQRVKRRAKIKRPCAKWSGPETRSVY